LIGKHVIDKHLLDERLIDVRLINETRCRRSTMKISNRQIADVTILDVSGRVVAGEAVLLRDSVRGLIAGGETTIVLNLAEVPYIDSAGIGELASALVAVRKQSGCLGLLNLSRRVRDVLGIVKLLTVFQVFENEAEALAKFTVPQNYPRELRARAG
jgi:anti-sigma B factor antagonist